jgi:hypothetical protein
VEDQQQQQLGVPLLTVSNIDERQSSRSLTGIDGLDRLEFKKADVYDVHLPNVNFLRKFQWHLLLSDPALYNLYLTHFTALWLSNTLQTQLPTFMTDELGFDIEHAGLILFGLYSMEVVGASASGRLADIMVNKGFFGKKFTLHEVRIFWQEFSNIGSAVALLLAAYSRNTKVVLGALYLADLTYGTSAGGFRGNFLDLAPSASALVSAFSSTFAQSSGIITPIVGAALIEGPYGWRGVFLLTVAFNLLSSVVWFSALSVNPIPGLD